MIQQKVLFICLGNICRSPMAEGVFRQIVHEKGLAKSFEIDSCGTSSYHIGSAPDKRGQKVCAKYGCDISALHARQLTFNDTKYYDFLIAMDSSNYSDTLMLNDNLLNKNSNNHLFKFRFFDNNHPDADVPDPWYGEKDGFETVYQIVKHCSENLLKYILQHS